METQAETETENYVNSAEMERSRANVQPETNTVQSGESNTLQSGRRRIFIVVGISLGLVCILQAVLNVSLRLHYNGRPQSPNNVSANLVTELLLEKEQLIKEKEQLTEEKEQLIKEKEQLTEEKEQLKEEKEQRSLELDQVYLDYNLLSDNLQELRKTLEQKQREIQDLRGLSVLRCPAGWDAHELSCYRRFPERRTWDEAVRSCEAIGAHLVTVNDEQEQDFVSSLVSSNVWMGSLGSYNPLTSEWTWTLVDGRRLCYTNWAYQSAPASTLCACIRQSSGRWFGAPCTNELPYICEKRMSSTRTVIPK